MEGEVIAISPRDPIRYYQSPAKNDESVSIGNPNTFDFRQTLLVPFQHACYNMFVEALGGKLLFQLVDNCAQTEIDLVDEAGDILVEAVGDILGQRFGSLDVLFPALLQGNGNENDGQQVDAGEDGYQPSAEFPLRGCRHFRGSCAYAQLPCCGYQYMQIC
ncbi:hypothetical protein AB6Q56_09705 [Dechloromonas sp. ARDL1]